MPFSLVSAGGSLYLVDSSGSPTALTLPTGVTLSDVEQTRFAIIERNVVAVNGPSKGIFITPDGKVYPAGIPAPPLAPTVAAGAAGSLTGAYSVKYTYVIKDDLGNVVAESDFSPVGSATVAAQALAVSALQVSGDSNVNCRRLYRTAAGGSVYFFWLDLDDNSTTSIEDGTADAGLSIEPPDDLGQMPVGAELIAAWKGRAFIKTRKDPDTVWFCSEGRIYAWPEEFGLDIKPKGQDERGVTAFLIRRDELGVGKRDMLAKIVGDDEDDFAVIVIAVGVGPVSQESVVVNQDIAYFLGEDGVYTWSADGVECISDEKVHDWFTSDTYFNRARFENATAHYDPALNAYVLCLTAAGSSTNDRWVYYMLGDKTWWGPHKSDLSINFPSLALLENSSDLPMPIFGASNGHLYKKQATRTDGTSTAIDFDVDTKFFSGDAPDITHYWGMLTVLSKILASGTLTITPKVGRLNASAGTAISHDMTTGRQRLRRLGAGALAQLNLRQNTAGVDCQIYGIEIPWHEIGRR